MGKEIGIDFGTTNTVVSYTNKRGRLRTLKYDGSPIIPSVIYFHSRDEFDIGAAAQNMLVLHPEAGIESFKMTLGETGKRYRITPETGGTFSCTPRQVTEWFLKEVIQRVESKLVEEFGIDEGTIDRAVVTVPVEFRQKAKEEIKAAVMSCGVPNIKLTAEPTAAAIAYLEQNSDVATDGFTVLVYDFGGGTFDVSVIRREGGRFKRITTDGDRALGGNDLTKSIEKYLIRRIEDDYDIEFPNEADALDDDADEEVKNNYLFNMKQIRDAANGLKEDLSESESEKRFVNLMINGQNERVRVSLTRKKLLELIGAALDHTVEVTERTVKAAKASSDVDEINVIVLAGGSSNIPIIRDKLQHRLRDIAIDGGSDASAIISQGAAILARRIEDIDNTTQSVTSVQIGTAAKEGMRFGVFQKLIAENVLLPAKGKAVFMLAHDGQKRLEIPYYEYDVKKHPNIDQVHQNGMEQIDTLIIDDLPPDLQRADTMVEVEFELQKDETLAVKVELTDRSGRPLMDAHDLKVSKHSDLE